MQGPGGYLVIMTEAFGCLLANYDAQHMLLGPFLSVRLLVLHSPPVNQAPCVPPSNGRYEEPTAARVNNTPIQSVNTMQFYPAL